MGTLGSSRASTLSLRDKGVFNNPIKPPKIKAGYGTSKKARNTIRRLRKETRKQQRQTARSMFFRAKYHKYQTPGMRNAMKIYGDFLKYTK
jgi:hypothetical protein